MSEPDQPEQVRPGRQRPGLSAKGAELHARGLVAAQRGDIDQAIALITRAIDVAPDQPTYRCHLADILQAVGQLEGAALAYGRALELDPSQIEVHYNLGTVRAALGDLTGAEAAYRGALALDPDFALALDNLGTVLQGLGRHDEAEDVYRRALEIEPDNPWAGSNLATVMCTGDRLAAAADQFRQVLAGHPDFAPAHCGLASVLHACGDLAGAEAEYRLALDLDPTSAQAHHHLGALLLAAGNFEAAAEACVRASKIFVHDASIHSNCGVALGARGRHAEAAVALARAVELEPDNPDHHYNLGVILERGGDCEAAAASYQRAVVLDPTRREAQDNLGAARFRLGQVDAALAAYSASLAIDPDNPTARHFKAALTGETTAAAPPEQVRATFDDYAATYDNHVVARLAYRVPDHIAAAIDRVAAGRRFALALDLGCGTGLLAPRLGDRVDQLDGVDLSARMVAAAAARALYRRLVVGEIVEVLRHEAGELAGTYELIAAADVLIYFGDLAPLLAAVRSRLSAGGLLVFSVEVHAGAGYALRASGRYAHSRDYIERLAAELGFAVVSCESVILRNEGDHPVAGLVFVLGEQLQERPSTPTQPAQ